MLAVYGVKPCIALPEGLSSQSKRILASAGIQLNQCGHESLHEPDIVVVVDAANPAQLGGYAAMLERPEAVVIHVDHHRVGRLSESATIRLVEPSAGSSSEILAVVAEALGIILDERVASVALTGIYYDTRRFSTPGVYSFQAASYLHGSGGTLILHSPAQAEPDFSERYARVLAASRARVARSCKELIVTVTHVGSFESRAASALIELGADVAVVVKEAGREGFRVSVRVSPRAVKNGVEASKIAEYVASKYGGQGGGHPRAGMAHIPRTDLDVDELVDALARSLPGKVARMCVEARRLAGGGKEAGSLR